MKLTRKFGLATLALGVLSVPATAEAYVGPGLGLTAIGTIVALAAALLLAVFGFVWYPVKRIMRSRRDGAEQAGETGSDRGNED